MGQSSGDGGGWSCSPLGVVPLSRLGQRGREDDTEWGSEGQPAPHLALAACYRKDSDDLGDKLGPLAPETHTPGSGAGRAAAGPSAAARRPGEPERGDSA